MSDKKTTYLENRIEATLEKNKEGTTITFQRAKVKLRSPEEIDFLKAVDPVLQKEITVTDDEIVIQIQKPGDFQELAQIRKKPDMARHLLALQLVKEVKDFPLKRLHPVVCPENICFDRSLTPYFYHYGVQESIPPYEEEQELLLNELKATVAYILDGTYQYDEYIRFHDSLKLSRLAKAIMDTATVEELYDWLNQKIKELENLEKTFISLPERKWQVQKIMTIILTAILVPVLLFCIYGYFFQLPKQQAYVKSGEYFVRQQYTEVIKQLSRYNPEKMPYVVKYYLATSYVQFEPLTNEQRENVQSLLTLQTDENYFLYWIYIGRGDFDEAIEIARKMEYEDLIIYGLLKQEEKIKNDDSLTAEKRNEFLEPIEREIQEFVEKQERLLEEEEKKENEQNQHAEEDSSFIPEVHEEQQSSDQDDGESDEQAGVHENDQDAEDTDARDEEQDD